MKRYSKTKIPYEEGKILSGKREDLNQAIDNIIKALNQNFDDLQNILRMLIPWVDGSNGFTAFEDGDASPSVANGNRFCTANTAPTTITDFDGGEEGQMIFLYFGDGNTTIDFTGTNLKGNAGVDWPASLGSSLIATKGPTLWYCHVSKAS